jgi:DNA-binding response OmpR family regulator
VITAAAGLDATRAALSLRTSLVLLDLELPLLDCHVGAWLRAYYGEGLLIVVVTATGQDVESAGAISPCAALRKPLNVDGLLTLGRRCLASGRVTAP